MRRTPVAAFAAALTVTIAVGLQMPVALAVDPVTLYPINDPSTSGEKQSGLVFLTQDQGAGAADVFRWYPDPAYTNPIDGSWVVNQNGGKLISVPASPVLQPNAVGFRTADGFIYGIDTIQSSEQGQLVQIGLNASGAYAATVLGIPTMSGGGPLVALKNANPTSIDAGTFGAGATADIMYLLAYGGDTLYQLNFGDLQGSGCTVDGVPNSNCLPKVVEVPLTPPNGLANLTDVADLFWMGNSLFGVYQYGCSGSGDKCAAHIYRINVNPNGVTTAGPVTVDDFAMPAGVVVPRDYSNHGYGSQWVYPNGDFGFATDKNTQMTYRCSMASPGAAAGGDLGITCGTPVVGPVGTNNPNDGTSNGRSGSISVTKSVDPATVAPGETATYSVTVTNNGPAWTGWVLNDLILPGNGMTTIAQADISYTASPSGSSALCTVGTDAAGSSTLRCATIGGPLPVGQSVTIKYKATAVSFNSLCELTNNVVAMPFAPATYAYDDATVTNSACTTPVPPKVDLGVTNQVRNITRGTSFSGSTPASATNLVEFSIVVDNGITGTSEGPTTGWSMEDLIPAGLVNIQPWSISSDFVPADVISGASCIWLDPATDTPTSSTTSPIKLKCTGTVLPLTASVSINFQAQVAPGAPLVIETDATVGHLAADETLLDTDIANKGPVAAKVLLVAAGGPPPANHTSSTGGAVTPGGSPVAAGMLFVLAAGLATWLVWSRRRPVVS